MPNGTPLSADKQIRYTRNVALGSAVALGASVTVGVGVYVLLGQIIEFSDATTASMAYLLALLAAVPIILTAAERVSVLPIRNGVYGLSQEGSSLAIPYLTGWIMFGGLACLAAVLGWGAAVYADLLLSMFTTVELPPIRWLATAFTIAGVGFALMWDRSRWQRYVVLILAAVAFLPLLTVRGFILLEPAIGNPRTTTVDLLDVTVMIAASFWAIHFVLSVRNELHRPTRNLLRALAADAVLRTLIGAAAALILVWYPGDLLFTDTPLNDIASLPGAGSGPIWQLTYALFGLVTCLYALRRTVDASKDLTVAMRRDGFIPSLDGVPIVGSRVDVALIAFWLLAIAASWFLSIAHVTELAAAGFLLSIGLAMTPAVLSATADLPRNRRLKLPFHPLFPGLTVAFGLLLTLLTLDTVGLYWLGWIGLGAVMYALFARASAVQVRREAVVVEDDSKSEPPPLYGFTGDRFPIMVSADKPDALPALLRAAALLVQGQGGDVIVVKVLAVPNYVSESAERRMAQTALEELQQQTDEAISQMATVEGLDVTPMVRLASVPAHGILDTAAEEKASLLLTAWRGQDSDDRRTPDAMLNDLVRYAPCPVAILRGDIAETLKRLVIFTAGGPNAAAALPIAQKLAEANGADIELVTINCDMEPGEAQKYLDETQQQAADPDRFDAHVVDAGSLQAGVASASEDADLVFFGVSKEDVSARSFFGGLGAELAFQSERSSMLVRGAETVRYMGVRRMVDSVRDTLPELSDDDRAEVAQNMRRGAIPTVDFFVLITLASAIATLGLLQSSTAVIIGAMLVAPLMSPILATGMAIVMGESFTLRLAVEATAKGIAVAILVGILMTIVSPFKAPTPEIVARTAPTVLDMMVALISGAAAGYAVCRKEVAAALPGVAISAALVPPLCVVGYGIGTSRFDIATGSLLLFATNLVAIIVAGAVVFLALGFHPPRSEREEFRRNLWVSGLSLGAVFVVLMIATIFTVRETNARIAVEQVFRQDMVQKAVVVDKLEVDRRGNEYFVAATVFAYGDAPMTAEDIQRVQQDLSRTVGDPVFVDLTIVPATGSDLMSTADLRALEEYVEAEAADARVSIAELQTRARQNDISMVATLVTYPESTLDERALDRWQEEMTELAGQSVVLEVSVVQGQRRTFTATTTPVP